MSRTSTLILLGILTILAPFSGLPIDIRNLLAVIFGASVTGIGLSIRAHEARSAAAQPPAEMPSVSEPVPPQSISPM
ncbi:MAG: hypothetical protein B7X03_03300 [Parcubacteria group bacterium 21-58-10]|nr:MAG: hypothetical protein B7X03_03300 [Parcubacteria group bacterium 21-58-10]